MKWRNLILVLEATLNGPWLAPSARLGNDLDDQAGPASANGGHRRFSDQNRRPRRDIGGLEG
jgi:hypothetical protein